MSVTIFKKEIKHKPINNQASMVVRKASVELLHTPPAPIPKTNFAPTQKEKVEAYCAELRKNIDTAEKWKAERGNRKSRQLKKWLFRCAVHQASNSTYENNVSTFKFNPIKKFYNPKLKH